MIPSSILSLIYNETDYLNILYASFITFLTGVITFVLIPLGLKASLMAVFVRTSIKITKNITITRMTTFFSISVIIFLFFIK